MTREDSNPVESTTTDRRDYLRILLALAGVGALSTSATEVAKAAHNSDAPYPSGAWGYAGTAGHGESERPSIAELEAAWNETYHVLHQDVDVGSRWYAEDGYSEWDLLPLVWDALDTPNAEDLPASGMTISLDTTTPEFTLKAVNSDVSSTFVGTVSATETILTTTALTFETTQDHDNAIAEQGVHHEQPTGTDWAASDVVEKGYPSYDDGGTNLVSHWTHNESSGATTLNDVTGTNDGTINGVSLNQSGILGFTAGSYDGTDDNTDLPALNAISGSQNRTLILWVNHPSGQGRARAWFSTGPNNTGERMTFRSSFNELRIERQGSGYTTSMQFEMDEWVMVGLVLDGSTLGDYTIYIWDKTGGLNSENASGTGGINTQPGTSDLIGNDTFNNWYQGTIGSVRLYDRALTSTEIQDLVDAVTGVSEIWYDSVAVGNQSQIELTTTSTIPANTSIDVTIYEDVGNDNTGSGSVTDVDGTVHNYDNSATQNLSGGTDETSTKSGFDGGATENRYIVQVEMKVTNSDPTTTSPTLSKVNIDV